MNDKDRELCGLDCQADLEELLEEYNKEKLENGDYVNLEEYHVRADDLLCKLLSDIGYDKVVELYRKVPKWYA